MAFLASAFYLIIVAISLSNAQRSPYAGPRPSYNVGLADRFINPADGTASSNIFDANNPNIGNRLSDDDPNRKFLGQVYGDNYAVDYIGTWNPNSLPFAYLNSQHLMQHLGVVPPAPNNRNN